jgi:hypothetical protein
MAVVNNGSNIQIESTNTFCGKGAGNLTTTGTDLVAYGANALHGATSVTQCVAIGSGAMQATTGNGSNVAVGYQAMQNANCVDDVAIGAGALANDTSGLNVAIGSSALNANTSGFNNVAIGAGAMTNANCSNDVAIGTEALLLDTGGSNVAIGTTCMNLNTSGNQNCGIGASSLSVIRTGSNNTCIGYSTGSNYSAAEANNVLIGSNLTGTAGESNVTRIGNGATSCFISGIEGVSVANTQMVTINTATNQMGSQAISAGTVTSVSGTANQVAVATGTTTPVISLIGPYSPATYTAHGVLIGEGTSSIVATTTGASGIPLIGQGSSADPIFGTAVVAGGGTGVSSWTDTNSLLCTGTSSTGAVQDVASVATGQVLTSAGTSTLPAWSAAPSVTSITLGGGTALANYVQGTFTPGIAFGGASTGITYTTQTGAYTRIGNVVFFTAIVTMSAVGSATGNATLTGMPLAAGNANERGFMTVANNFTYTTGYTNVEWTSAASTNFAIAQFGAGVNVVNATNANFAANTSLRITGFYFT